MEDFLKEIAKNNEKVLWKGKPETVKTFEGGYKQRFIKKSIIAVAVAVLLNGLYAYLAIKNEVAIKPALIIVVLVLAMMSPYSCIAAAKKLNEITYVFTDERISVIRNTVINSVPYSKIDAAEIKSDDIGHEALLCGEDAIKQKPDEWRERTVYPASMDDTYTKCLDFVLYSLPKDKMLYEILRTKLPMRNQSVIY